MVSGLAEKIHNLPPLPGVYLFKDMRGEVLYVGKALSLAQRTRNYLATDVLEPRIREMVERAHDIDTIATSTEAEALLLEATLIRQHRPHYNILLKDDKSFPYVKITVQEEVPRLSITRQVRSDGARYLGPYTDVKHLRRTLREMRRIFPVRTCRNFEDHRRANRPCLYFHIRRCAGPCTTRSRVSPPEYRALVDGLVLFLTGRDGELLKNLKQQMARASDAREFEHAARLRDQISLLDKARVPQSMVVPGARDTDVIGLARHGSRAAAATLVVREGRVIGKESRFIERGGALEDAELLSVVLTQHYLYSASLPRRLVMGVLPADTEVVREALSHKASGAVEFAIPQRGRERQLLIMAQRNAPHGPPGALLGGCAGVTARAVAVLAAPPHDLFRHFKPGRRTCRGRRGGERGREAAALAVSQVAHPPPRPGRLRHDRRGGEPLLGARDLGRAAAPRSRRDRRRHRAVARGPGGDRSHRSNAGADDRARQA